MAQPHLAIAEFDDLAPHDAIARLRAACGSPAWQRVLVAGRPYGSVSQLAAASDGVIAALGWGEVEQALAADADLPAEAVRDDAQERAYRERFGVPFAVDPTGKTAEQLQDLLRERLAHDPEAEQQVVRRELAALVRLRLAKAFR